MVSFGYTFLNFRPLFRVAIEIRESVISGQSIVGFVCVGVLLRLLLFAKLHKVRGRDIRIDVGRLHEMYNTTTDT